MADLERIADKKDKLSDFQGKYNSSSKSIVHHLGTNIALYICILIPIALIGFIWTDFGMPVVGLKFISEGIVTVALFIIGEVMMMSIGSNGGKLDPEYINARNEFKSLLREVEKVGTLLLGVFCEWQIDVELDQAITARCRPLHITRAEWNKLKDMPFPDLKKKYGRNKARRIIALTRLEPVEINEALLLYDNTDDLTRGGVPISGAGYLRSKMRSPEMVLGCIFAGLLTISVAIAMTQDVSMARVIYTLFKLIILFYRMASGYAMGAKAFNTIEVRQIRAKCNYLRQYIMFVEDKIYINLEKEKYGNVKCFVSEERGIEVKGNDSYLEYQE